MIDIRILDQEIKALPEKEKAKNLVKLIQKHCKTKDFVTFDENILHENVLTAKAFFTINCSHIKDPREKVMFIEQYKNVFYYWYSTDSIISLVSDCDFEFLYKKAKEYVNDWQTYTRRWGWVMFIFHPCRKDEESAKRLLSLFHNDQKETNQMAQAWLLCELAIFNPELIYNYLLKCKLSYRIVSKAVSKINDSYRISNEWKIKFKEIRNIHRERINEI